MTWHHQILKSCNFSEDFFFFFRELISHVLQSDQKCFEGFSNFQIDSNGCVLWRILSLWHRIFACRDRKLEKQFLGLLKNLWNFSNKFYITSFSLSTPVLLFLLIDLLNVFWQQTFSFFFDIITVLGIGCKGTENILGTRFLHNVSKAFLSFFNYTVLHSDDTFLFYLEVHIYAQTGEQRTLDSHHLQGRN